MTPFEDDAKSPEPETNNLLMLPPDILKAALLFVAKGVGRAYLNGLHVQVAGGDVAVTASDGAACFRHCIPDYAGIADIELVIPREHVQLALSLAKKGKLDYVPLNLDACFLGEVGFRPIGHKYPAFPLDKLFAGERPASANYDIELLHRLQQASDIVGPHWLALPKLRYFERCAKLEIDDNTFALAMRADDGDEGD